MFKSLSKSVSRNPKQELAQLQADYRKASFFASAATSSTSSPRNIPSFSKR